METKLDKCDRNRGMTESFEGRQMLLGDRCIDKETALAELRWLWGRRYPKDKLTRADVRVEDGQWWGSCEYVTPRKGIIVSWTKIKLVGCRTTEMTNEELGRYVREGWFGVNPIPILAKEAVVKAGHVHGLNSQEKTAIEHFYPVLLDSGYLYGGTTWRAVIAIEKKVQGIPMQVLGYTARIPSKAQLEWIRRYENDKGN
jgi:hypothetical protein